MQGHTEASVQRYLELSGKHESPLHPVATPCLDDHLLDPADDETKGALEEESAKISVAPPPITRKDGAPNKKTHDFFCCMNFVASHPPLQTTPLPSHSSLKRPHSPECTSAIGYQEYERQHSMIICGGRSAASEISDMHPLLFLCNDSIFQTPGLPRHCNHYIEHWMFAIHVKYKWHQRSLQRNSTFFSFGY